MKYYFGPRDMKHFTKRFSWHKDIYYSLLWGFNYLVYLTMDIPYQCKKKYAEWKRVRELKRILKDPHMQQLQRLAGITKVSK